MTVADLKKKTELTPAAQRLAEQFQELTKGIVQGDRVASHYITDKGRIDKLAWQHPIGFHNRYEDDTILAHFPNTLKDKITAMVFELKKRTRPGRKRDALTQEEYQFSIKQIASALKEVFAGWQVGGFSL